MKKKKKNVRQWEKDIEEKGNFLYVQIIKFSSMKIESMSHFQQI